MLTYQDIIKEDDPRLRQKSLPVTLPLAEEDLQLLLAMNEYLEAGYDEEKTEACGIRPGVGLKKIIAIFAYDEKGGIFHYGFINPKIISNSVETAYLPSGEGCLSVDREVPGLVHRPRRIKVRSHVYDFKDGSLSERVLALEGFLAIVFQHEYDHLNGILFFDRIDQTNPFTFPKTAARLFSNRKVKRPKKPLFLNQRTVAESRTCPK